MRFRVWNTSFVCGRERAWSNKINCINIQWPWRFAQTWNASELCYGQTTEGKGRLFGCNTRWTHCFSGSVKLLPLQNTHQSVPIPNHRAKTGNTSHTPLCRNIKRCVLLKVKHTPYTYSLFMQEVCMRQASVFPAYLP